MKKISVLLLAMVLTLTVTGCGNKVTTKTCTIKQSNATNTFKLSATNDQIDKLDLIIVMDNKAFGSVKLSELTDKQKETVKSTMLKTLGLDKAENEGFEIDVKIEDEMTITLKADLKKADPAILKKVGMDFTGADMSLKRAVKDMEARGATCK